MITILMIIFIILYKLVEFFKYGYWLGTDSDAIAKLIIVGTIELVCIVTVTIFFKIENRKYEKENAEKEKMKKKSKGDGRITECPENSKSIRVRKVENRPQSNPILWEYLTGEPNNHPQGTVTHAYYEKCRERYEK